MMNTANISLSNSKVVGTYNTMVLRLGLLISDFTYTVGDLYYGIMAENMMSKEVTIRQKFDYTAMHIKAHPEMASMAYEEFENVGALHRYYKSVKYKSPNEIKQIRALESTIDNLFAERNKYLLERFSTNGMTQLKKFVGVELKINPISPTSPEVRSEDTYHLMSEILIDRFNDKTGDDIYMVTADFGNYLKKHNAIIADFGKDINKEAEVLRAQNVFELPTLLHLSENELEMVRTHLLGTNEVFRTNMAKWNTDLISIPFEKNNFKSINKQFIEEILPQTKLLQIEMDKNERLRLIKSKASTIIEFSVNFYVTNVGFYWDYLMQTNTITEATMNKLIEYPDYEKLKNSSCIIIEGALLNENEVENPDEEIVLTKRKTLDI